MPRVCALASHVSQYYAFIFLGL